MRRPRSEPPAPWNPAGLASDNLAYMLRPTRAADYAPEEIAEIAEKVRVKASLSKAPAREVANGTPSTKARRAPRKKAAVQR